MDSRPQTTWPPPPEAIEEWLAGFRRAWSPSRLPPTEHDLELRIDRRRESAKMVVVSSIVVILAALVNDRRSTAELLLLAHVGLCLAVARRLRRPGHARGPRVLVEADGCGVTVTCGDRSQRARWDQLVGIDPQEWRTALHLDSGAIVSLPRDKALDRVVGAARQVIAERAAHHQVSQARMARGLSRPAGEEQAERGLSVVE